ncbi:poly-gamma-glutamate biosynthesis protein PgsC/CapC [Pseudoalteromonas sp. MMG022]|uniref:poly-gamma-glutamate biosynthesis protein PgsC/CapC n=1 Tax=Pseudoalteromonas sp. MMG022 TaxID=2909978 RepID=UPI001F197DFC|nr:poly-gamma-glutamate biosynthesis protein PgsC/CapC [Pseudoalteromonas sp. MMG022]MCF6435946.1 poly-gamma-glutamate biosynthesis protein PgsC/CapC [Pseudoalteromonas sp. MMG022]
MDWVIHLFPSGSGLGQSVITTVWVGIAVVCFFNLRFGFPLTGLVVPGYLVPLLIVSPTSAAVILIEAIIVYWLMRLSAQTLMEKLGYAEMFGRDRFFAIILISILVRVCMDSLLWPVIANELRLWDITFDYASELHSLGLVIIALAANVMWNHGFKYGLKVTATQLLCTYIAVRYVLMPFTNFSIANLAIMYETVASSIVAAPKAYIILVLTAFIASRANLRYGWEFNGILLPALLALQLLEPTKLLTSFVETAIILLIAGSLLRFTRLKQLGLEGAGLLFFFFNVGFVYKLLLNYLLVYFYPSVKVTDAFAFGYMLSTLLALKIYQKSALGLIIRATFQTSILGGALAIMIGFLMMFVPSLFTTAKIASSTAHAQPLSVSTEISEYKSLLYTANQTPSSVAQYQHNLNISQFKRAISALAANRNEPSVLNATAIELAEIGFNLYQDQRHIYIQDHTNETPRGMFVLNKYPLASHVVTMPYPVTERSASDVAGILFTHLKSSALALGNAQTFSTNETGLPQSRYYGAFIEVLAANEVLQLRELNRQSRKTLPKQYQTTRCHGWIYHQIPSSINQTQLTNLLACGEIEFGLVSPSSLPYPAYKEQMLEIFVDTDSYINLLAKVALTQTDQERFPIAQYDIPVSQAVANYTPHISAKGSGHFVPLSHKDAALWEFEILRPLYQLAERFEPKTLDENLLGRLAYINRVSHIVGYQLSLIHSNNTHYFMLSPRAEPRFYQLGQGIYFIRLGQASHLNIQVPRPLFESHTLKFSAELFDATRAKSLLIAGAHPYAATQANVLKPINVNSLFNVIYQSLLRYDSERVSMHLQLRSHSTPSDIRPTALAFAHTFASDKHQPLIQQLRAGLTKLGVDYELVSGQKATRGLEIGSSAQSGYDVFSAHSELATLWLASDYKQHFAVSNDALLQRFGAISVSSQPLNLDLSEPKSLLWHPLGEEQYNRLKTITHSYAQTHNLAQLSTLCNTLSSCTLNVARLAPSGTIALVLKHKSAITAIYLPNRNMLINQENFTDSLLGGEHVLY